MSDNPARRTGRQRRLYPNVKPELTPLRRGLASLGIAALVSLSLLGATPAGGHGPGQHPDATTGSASRTVDDRAGQHKTPKADSAGKKQSPRPVAGLSRHQMNRAITIVRAGRELDVSRKGQAVAVATAMQESKLKVLANHAVPESGNYDNDGFGADHDSVGLFQQRPSMGWGTVEQCMDAEHSATTFYKALKDVDGWKDMSLARAAQEVQASAYPDAYARWEKMAFRVVDEVNGR